MTHDPLCIGSRLPEEVVWPDQCRCDLIHCVREDERMRDDDYAYVATQSYAAALRDVLKALESERTDGSLWWHKPWNNALFSAEISIRALGGER